MFWFSTTILLVAFTGAGAAKSTEHQATQMPSVTMFTDTLDLLYEVTAAQREATFVLYKSVFPVFNTDSLHILSQQVGTTLVKAKAELGVAAGIAAREVNAAYYKIVVPNVNPHINAVRAELDPLLAPVCAEYNRYVAPYIFKTEDIYAVGREMKFQLWLVQHAVQSQVSNVLIPSVARVASEVRTASAQLIKEATQPITLQMKPGHSLLLRHGLIDVSILVVWLAIWFGTGLLALYVAAKFVVLPALRAIAWTVNFLLVLAYMLIFRVALGAVFFALRLVTLNYMCKCCGLCATRKKRVISKVAAKKKAVAPAAANASPKAAGKTAKKSK